MTPYQKSLWKEAQRCVRRGWGIVLIQGIADDPVAANSSKRPGGGKRPITKNGVNDATIDLAKIKTWIKKHPNANIMAICQRNEERLHEVGTAFGLEKRYSSYDELLKDKEIDAVHINTPIPNHVQTPTRIGVDLHHSGEAAKGRQQAQL